MNNKAKKHNSIVFPFIVKLLLCCSFFCTFSNNISAQYLSGKIFTINEKGDTVAIYMARLQWKSTAIGTYSEMDGTYRLARASTDTLIVSYSFYKSDTIVINKRVKQRNFLINTAQQLQEVIVSKNRKKYKRKNNPAVELVEKVIENKQRNSIESFDSYKSKEYQKMVVTFGRFNMDFQKNRFNRQLSFLEKYIDTLPDDTIPVLTISLRENLSDYYYQKAPQKTIRYVIAKRMQGIDESLDDEGLGNNIESIFPIINIFDNDIEIMLNKFVSPLSSTLATLHYHYFITDTVKTDSVSYIELTFTPANDRGLGFSGKMYIINDSSYALKKYILNVPVNININFLRQLIIEQDYEKMEGCWAPNKSNMVASFSLIKRKKMRQLYFNQTTLNYDYTLGIGIPDSLSEALNGDKILASDVWKYKSGRWSKLRPIPLSAKESFIDSIGPELRRLPLFRALEKGAEILGTGYIATAKERKKSPFDIGPIYDIISYNQTEGLRLRIGGTSTAKLHNQFFVSGYLAFGCKDLKLKYNTAFSYSFIKKDRYLNEFPKNVITFSASYDLENPGQHYKYLDRDNLFMSYNVGVPETSAQYVRRAKLRYECEWQNHLSVDAWLLYENNESAGSLRYIYVDENGSERLVKNFNNYEMHINLRWAPGARKLNSRTGKESVLKLSKNAPIFSISHTIGFMDNTYWFNQTDLSIEKRFWLSAFGHIDVMLQGGIVWDKVPFPKLYIPQNSQSLFMTQNTFRLMKPTEFIMDKYISLHATYYLKGLIFNLIPFWNRLNLREVVSFGGVYGKLSAKNNPNINAQGLYLLPDNCSPMGKVPYMEITAGIENIFRVLRIDYVRRLTYTNGLSGWGKNGIRLSLRLTF